MCAQNRFTLAYLNRAAGVFFHPNPTYAWIDIIRGAAVATESGNIRQMCAVAPNTFRGFHRVNQNAPGAQTVFVEYFSHNRHHILDCLRGVHTRVDLHAFSNQICSAIQANLSNIRPVQLTSYNKLRKPVDLYIEHLVAMADDFAPADRARLVPLLHLPLDSWMFGTECLFTEAELRANYLRRTSTYSALGTEQAYLNLQGLLIQCAQKITVMRGMPFHVIYFDMLWRNRAANWGHNLFETNPEPPTAGRVAEGWTPEIC